MRFIMIIGRGGFVCAASISMWLFWDQDYFTSNFDYFLLVLLRILAMMKLQFSDEITIAKVLIFASQSYDFETNTL